MIGERLSELRRDAGLTQDQLAEILKINKHSISSYERGKSEPPDEIKIALARYFGVTVDYLLGLSDTDLPAGSPRVLRLPDDLSEEDVRLLNDLALFLSQRPKS